MNHAPRIPAALSLDGLGDDVRASIILAAESGYAGIAFPTNHPQLQAQDFGFTARRHLQRILESHQLGLQSIRIAAPRAGLCDPTTIDRTVDNALKAIVLAHDMGVGNVSLHAGMISDLKVSSSTLESAVREITDQAQRTGVTLSLSADSTSKLETLLTHCQNTNLRAILAPGQTIADGEEPIQAAHLLAGQIGLVALSDAIRSGNAVRAVELGQGQVPWAELFQTLREQEFRGPLVVDVRELTNAPNCAAQAATTLRPLLLPNS